MAVIRAVHAGNFEISLGWILSYMEGHYQSNAGMQSPEQCKMANVWAVQDGKCAGNAGWKL